MPKFLFTACIFLAFALGMLSSCTQGKYPISDHFDGSHFYNPDSTYETKSLWDVLKWRMSSRRPEWTFRTTEVLQEIPRNKDSNTVRVTWVNHSTFLIQIDTFHILTDPVWSERVSPVSWAGPKRYHPPAIPIHKLQKVDFVLISHNHYDHLDLATLDTLKKLYNPKILHPLGDEELLEGEGFTHNLALDWWDQFDTEGLKITFTPSRHWSARGLFDRYDCLWGAYRIETPHKSLYFAGDTGYGPHFAETYKKLGPVDVAFLPIGAFKPEWFMKQNHMGPREVLPAMKDLQATRGVVMHMGTFALGDDGQEEPKILLDSLLAVTPKAPEIHYPQTGQILDF